MEFNSQESCDLHEECNSVSISIKWKTVSEKKQNKMPYDYFSMGSKKKRSQLMSESNIFDDREIVNKVNVCPDSIEKLCEELKNPPANVGESLLSVNDDFNVIPKNRKEYNKDFGLDYSKLDSTNDLHGKKSTTQNNWDGTNIDGCMSPSMNVTSLCPVCGDEISKNHEFYFINFTDTEVRSFHLHFGCTDKFVEEAENIIEENIEEIVAGRI